MSHPLVGIIMGSDSDWPKIKAAAAALAEFRHRSRSPRDERAPHAGHRAGVRSDGRRAGPARDHCGGRRRGPPGRRRCRAYRTPGDRHSRAHRIGGWTRFVALDGADAGDVPVATVGVGSGGARNAGLLAVQMLALADPALQEKYTAYKRGLVEKVLAKDAALQATLAHA